MQPLFEKVVDLQTGAEVLRARRFGLIEVFDGRLKQVCLRPWPKIGSLAEARCWGRWLHERRPGIGPLAGWRWVYFSDPDGLALELVEVAYYLKEEREAATAEYLRTRPSLAEIEARLT